MTDSSEKGKSALVTGGAGFIGSHLVDRLLKDDWHVTVVDNFDPFYDRATKEANIEGHVKHPRYRLIEADIRDTDSLDRVPGRYDVIVHLAARPGVRPSIADPISTQEINVGGTQNMLEFARIRKVEQFVFASSSSVYGVNPNVPWSEKDHVLMPISPYASSKVSGELIGHVYSHLYGIRFIGLRFFTVYGPRQRPDLAIHKFSRLLTEGKPIPMFGDGSTRRDYTYVDDVVAGVVSALSYKASSYEIMNLGNHRTVSLREMIERVSQGLGVTPHIERQPDQPGDVPQTFADISHAKQLLGFNPETGFGEGIAAFCHWFHQKVVPESSATVAL